jgi:hypothetical protein
MPSANQAIATVSIPFRLYLRINSKVAMTAAAKSNIRLESA